jgi:hypothetical protein
MFRVRKCCTRSLAFSRAYLWYSGWLARLWYCVRLGSSSDMKWSLMKDRRIGCTGLFTMFFGLNIL